VVDLTPRLIPNPKLSNLFHPIPLTFAITITIMENFNVGCNVRNAVGLHFDPTDKQKKATRRLLKKLGEEDQFTGICAKCSWVGVLAKKNQHNSHYGCTDYCCPLLHQWNVCDDCLAETRKEYRPVSKSPERQVEVLKFQRVFSRLPDDVQRYIGEFVPRVFDFVKISGRLFRAARLFYNIDRHSKLLGSLWKDSLYGNYRHAVDGYNYKGGPHKHSSGKEICRQLKQLYRKYYRFYMRLEASCWSFGFHFYSVCKGEFLESITEILI